jgi:hypothetical protein
VTEDDDPLAGFNPDDALEEIRRIIANRIASTNGVRQLLDPLARLIGDLDSCIVRSGGTRLPQDWQYEPAVHFERLMRNQPRRTSREERRR